MVRFDCLDPEASDFGEKSDCDVGYPEYIADGYCDYDVYFAMNTEACAWDGGDCCNATCQSAEYNCGEYSSYVCLDPDYFEAGSCLAPKTSYLADGWCDSAPYVDCLC